MERRAPAVEKPDLTERGGLKDGQPQTSDRRLFMQFLAFGGARDTRLLSSALERSGLSGVLYEDANDPFGVALLVMSEEPLVFARELRRFIQQSPFEALRLKDEHTMLGRTYSLGYEPDLQDALIGRTYSLGYEPDLQDALIGRPRRVALNPAWNWAVWYPLRRNGAFTQLPPEEQRAILGEHGLIGRSFGEADFAHDIRLACHGLDKHDNDFVIGLVGKELHPLSALVQTMRKTRQTSQFLERLGPFFVGRAVWRGQ